MSKGRYNSMRFAEQVNPLTSTGLEVAGREEHA